MKVKKVLTITLCALLVLGMSAMVVLAATSILSPDNKVGNAKTESNPDDNSEYITKGTNSVGGNEYKSTRPAITNAPIAHGKIVVDGDYMYVYGFYYVGSSSALNTSSLDGWTEQVDDLGWGCAAISKTKSSYGDPKSTLEDVEVTRFDNCWYKCTSMTKLPVVPATAKSTTNMCNGCSALKQAEVELSPIISAGSFTGCNLEKVYVGANVTTVEANAFGANKSGVPTYTVYVEFASKPSGWNSSWKVSAVNVKWDADRILDYLPQSEW